MWDLPVAKKIAGRRRRVILGRSILLFFILWFTLQSCLTQCISILPPNMNGKFSFSVLLCHDRSEIWAMKTKPLDQHKIKAHRSTVILLSDSLSPNPKKSVFFSFFRLVVRTTQSTLYNSLSRICRRKYKPTKTKAILEKKELKMRKCKGTFCRRRSISVSLSLIFGYFYRNHLRAKLLQNCKKVNTNCIFFVRFVKITTTIWVSKFNVVHTWRNLRNEC